MDRKEFLKLSSIAALGLSLKPEYLFASNLKPKISLAQWSLHKSLFSNQITTLDFPKVTRQTYGLDAVEYVNQFFFDKAKDQNFIRDLKKSCDETDHGSREDV